MDRAKLTEQIIELQQQIGRAMARYAPDAWMDMDLTIGQLRTLFFVDFEGSTNTERLANALGVTRRSVSATVDHLVERGLVTREKHPEDRRMVLVKTTDQGEALMTKLRESQMTRMSGMLARLSVDELSDMAHHLATLAKVVQASHEEKKS